MLVAKLQVACIRIPQSKAPLWLVWFGPRGAGIRRLTGRQETQGNPNYKGRLIRHTGQSGHGSGDSGPKWLGRPRPEHHAKEKSSHHRGGGHGEIPQAV